MSLMIFLLLQGYVMKKQKVEEQDLELDSIYRAN
jgi:hypothetical protein